MSKAILIKLWVISLVLLIIHLYLGLALVEVISSDQMDRIDALSFTYGTLFIGFTMAVATVR